MNPTDNDERTDTGLLGNTRRQFMVGAAGVAAGSALIGPAVGQAEEDEEEEGDEPIENDFEDDVAILNYALTLEYLEARFYAEGLETIGEERLCSCPAIPEDSPLQERLFDEIQTIQQHEEQHIETLIGAIEELGGEPIEEPSFDFGIAVEYPMAFLGTAAQLEDVGVSAYAGAAPDIEAEELLPPALGIHSVEARHASFLRTITNETGFPNVIDEARSRDEVLDIAGEYIVEGEEAEEPDEEPDDDTEEPVENETDEPTDNVTDDPDNVTEEPAVNDTNGDNLTDGDNLTNGDNLTDDGNLTNGDNLTDNGS